MVYARGAARSVKVVAKKIKNWFQAATSRLRPATKRDVEDLRQIIMANTAALLEEIRALKGIVETQTAQIGELTTQVGKVGSETDSLVSKIAELEETIRSGGTPEEIAAAFAEVRECLALQQTAIGGLGAAIGGVDSKVDDALTPPPAG